ncbi:MAG TPA: V-type ATP synthase subunit F [Micromonosporaceae bacterium]
MPTAVPIVAAIGSPVMVRGYALAGVRVLPAEDADEVRDAWRSLPADVGLVVLTEQAAQALADTLTAERTWPLVAVMS